MTGTPNYSNPMITMRYSIKLWALPVVALLAMSGCDSNLTGVNEDPNSPTKVDAAFLLPNAITGGVSLALGSNLHMDLTALWAQHYAESQYSTEDRYDLTDSKVSGIWSGFYAGPLEDLHQIIRQGEATNRPNVTAVGLTLRAWAFNIVTDLWGDIGYSDALMGMEEGGSKTPKYDSQSAVYDGMLADLASVADLIDKGTPIIKSGDLLYQGDMDKWVRFANSLRMRLAMRLSKVDASKAQQAFAAAYAAGGFQSSADNAQLKYVGDGTWDYPIFTYQKSRNDHAVSATLIDTLKSLADPRLPIYANKQVDGEYEGMPNGYDETHEITQDAVSRIGTRFASANTPAVLMSYAELLFLQAEAAERGWITEDAGALYNKAITEHMRQLDIDQGAIDAYLAQPAVAYTAGADGLRRIAVQKWIALYGNGPEAYAEWRRTDYPNLVSGPHALNERRIPRRLIYPTIETALNGKNLQEAVSRQGGAGLNDRVWWDK
jgi:hypothetical protein